MRIEIRRRRHFPIIHGQQRTGGAPADAEGITPAEDEEEGLNDADRSTLYNLFKEDLQF